MKKEKINQLKLKNFKILKDVTLNFGDLTLLCGVNSSGKSTLVQSLIFLKQNQRTIALHEALNSTNSNDDKIKDFFSQIEANIDFNSDLLDIGGIKDLMHQDCYGEDQILIDLCAKNNRLLCSIQYHKNNLSAQIDGMLKNINLFSDGFQYIHTHRMPPKDSYPMRSSIISDDIKMNLGKQGEYVAYYLANFGNNNIFIKELKHPDATNLGLLNNVECWLREISNNIRVHPAIDERHSYLSYSYLYNSKESNKYRPQNVGFGITYALPIIVSILKSEPNDLLIIENPETHLHPSAQVVIANLCALATSCGVQVIIETHSDHFLNGIRVATKKGILDPKQTMIHFFEKEELETKIYHLSIDKTGRIEQNWPKGFFDEYEKQLDALLW